MLVVLHYYYYYYYYYYNNIDCSLLPRKDASSFQRPDVQMYTTCVFTFFFFGKKAIKSTTETLYLLVIGGNEARHQYLQ